MASDQPPINHTSSMQSGPRRADPPRKLDLDLGNPLRGPAGEDRAREADTSYESDEVSRGSFRWTCADGCAARNTRGDDSYASIVSKPRRFSVVCSKARTRRAVCKLHILPTFADLDSDHPLTLETRLLDTFPHSRPNQRFTPRETTFRPDTRRNPMPSHERRATFHLTRKRL
jgi:hypothetical protein